MKARASVCFERRDLVQAYRHGPRRTPAVSHARRMCQGRGPLRPQPPAATRVRKPPTRSVPRQRLQCAAAITGAGPSGAGVVAVPAATKLVAVLLGYACLVGSCFRSVPQIAKVWRNRSVEGLSTTTNVVELLCYTIVVAYNLNRGYPFNTYGEVLACWLQDIVLVSMIFAFRGTSALAACLSVAGFSGLCLYLFGGACPRRVLATLQLATIVIMPLFARLPQVLLNFRRGNSGMLSTTTCLLNVLGNLVRIFTTTVLTGDRLLFAGSMTQGVLNSVLLYQSVCTLLQRSRAQTGLVREEVEESVEEEGAGVLAPLPAAA